MKEKQFWERLRDWRAAMQYSEADAVTQIRRAHLDISLRRFRELECGAEPTPDERYVLDILVPSNDVAADQAPPPKTNLKAPLPKRPPSAGSP